MASAKKKHIKTGASSGHITNLKQSILETFDIYGSASKQQSVTQFTIIVAMNLVAPKADAKNEHLFNKLASVVGLFSIKVRRKPDNKV
jgi:hypothetical protein